MHFYIFSYRTPNYLFEAGFWGAVQSPPIYRGRIFVTVSGGIVGLLTIPRSPLVEQIWI